MEVNEDRDETEAWGKEEGNKGPGSVEDTDLLRGEAAVFIKVSGEVLPSVADWTEGVMFSRRLGIERGGGSLGSARCNAIFFEFVWLVFVGSLTLR